MIANDQPEHPTTIRHIKAEVLKSSRQNAKCFLKFEFQMNDL